MKQTLSFIFAIVLLVTAACKDNARICPEALAGDDCETFEDRSYPLLDISNDPEVWYRATIEGQETTMGSDHEHLGFEYLPGWSWKQVSLPDGQMDTMLNCLEMQFLIVSPSQEMIGKSYSILSFLSPAFSRNLIDNKVDFVAELFSPGVKKVGDGTNTPDGWEITMEMYDNFVFITRQPETIRFSTEFARQSQPDNYFEITQTTAEDLGNEVRFTIWCKFNVQLYRNGNAKTPGSFYFGPIEQGTAKLYVDVAK